MFLLSSRRRNYFHVGATVVHGKGGLQRTQPLRNTWGRGGSICVRTSSMKAAVFSEMFASLQISARCQNPKNYQLIGQYITSVSGASV